MLWGAIAVLLSAIVFLVITYIVPGSELLVVSGSTNDGRIVLLINPRDGGIVTPNLNLDKCKYTVTQIGSNVRLVGTCTRPGKLVVLRVSRRGHVSSVHENPLPDELEITSESQWPDEDHAFFIGILDQKEQVFMLDVRTGNVLQVTAVDPGMVVEFAVSPDRRHLAYRVYPNAANRHEDYSECFEGCSGFYRLSNLVEGTELAISELWPFSRDVDQALVQPPHCGLTWSPNSRYFAFQAGCNVNDEPQQIVVIEAESGSVVGAIGAGSEYLPWLSLKGWLTSEAVIYENRSEVTVNGTPVPRYYTYSVGDRMSREVAEFPVMDDENTPFYLWEIDWTKDGEHIVGVDYAANDLPRLVIIRHGGLEDEIRYTSIRGTRPIWSSSARWIGYGTQTGVGIADRNGKEVYRVSLSEEMRYYELAWLPV